MLTWGVVIVLIIAGLAAFVEHASAIPSKFRVCNKGKERLAVRMRRNGVLDNVSISHLNNAPAGCGSLRVMSNHDDGLIETIVQFLKHLQDNS